MIRRPARRRRARAVRVPVVSGLVARVLAVSVTALSGLALSSLAIAGCATSPRAGTGSGGPIAVVAIESFWGSLAAQLGGDRARVTSIISNPNVDPHDYEPSVADARALARARLVIINGVGYDTWASKLAGANPVPGRVVLTVGDLVGVKPGGNPHRWYSPPDVRRVIDKLTEEYQRADPAAAGYFSGRHDEVLGSVMKPYFDLIDEIRGRYPGTPVGASESIFTPLADALGLRLLTPESFLDAISEGGEPSAADKLTIDRQIRGRQIKVYVYNAQNVTPDVNAQVAAARAAGIQVTTLTETPSPAGAPFQDWQVRELTALRDALARASGA